MLGTKVLVTASIRGFGQIQVFEVSGAYSRGDTFTH